MYDSDLGTLDEENLLWYSDQVGLLGNGATFTTASLNAGVHTITLMADDGYGQHWIDQVIVTVVASPNDLPPQPDALIAGPDLVFLEPVNGINAATIYLDNLNLGNPIEWTVSSDKDWVELSSYSGLTPQDLTVSTSLRQIDFGTQKALLTFTSPERLFDPVDIVVIATITKYDLFLPVMLR